MMKFLLMMIMMYLMCFLSNMFWMVQMMLLLLMLLFMMLIVSIYSFTNLSYMMGVDMISFGMLMLSIWICMLMIMASEKYFLKNNNIFFLSNILLLLFMLMLTFSVMNLFLFYLFFEMSLIPTLMLILGWGYQSERVQAGMYLLFYTLFMSLPMLLGIFYIYNSINSMMMYLMKFNNFNMMLLYLSMIMAFLVKMPMYFVHLWLPKAHVEAPISGSMILAGVMLKLGGYGLMRVMIFLQEINMKLNYIWIVISLIGGVFISFKCLCQIDMKSLVAYSSVVHMGIVIGGIMTVNYLGYMSSFYMMIGHGLCSSGLFCLLNMNYERLNSRSLFMNKGLLNFMPSLSLWWFLLITSNMSAPPSMNLMGEIGLIMSLISWSKMTMIMLMLISLFSLIYGLYLYSFTQHGKYNMSIYSFNMGVSREYLLLMLHWLPLNILILKIDYLVI